MTIKRILFCSLWAVLVSLTLSAQNARTSSWRFKTLSISEMSLHVDSLSIVPGSFCIYDIPDSIYLLDPVSATLYLRDSSLVGCQIQISYAVFALDFSTPMRHRTPDIAQTQRYRLTYPTTSLATVADLVQEDRMFSSGSLSRGVSVGNNSDFVLNSALNLQLSGNLSEDVSVMASVTDKNIPIQPEGTTQCISDISSVFIHIFFKDFATLKVGDLEMKASESEFLSASRNLLGLDFSIATAPTENLLMNSVVGGGVSKGKFVRQNITVQNGVQGPYKLYGKENEVNIAVVAGSERVYVDGVLLTRGQENDYVMDYNTAEITFTPSMLVTSEKRVVVEMEYTDKHYTRYNIYTYNELQLGKRQQWKLNVNYFQEQDLKNQSIQPELTDDQKLFLAGLGDNELAAYYLSADSTQYVADRILYEKKDTIVNGILYNAVYQYSNDKNATLFTLSFTYVGVGKGNYKLLRSTSNGRVFGWVAPENGVCQGDYEPVLQLITPKLLQMATVAAEYLSEKGTSVQTELALSNSDKNTFSRLEDDDNVGFAYSLKAKHNQWLGRDTSKLRGWRLRSELGWQFVHKNFSAVESFREVEFARDYNLNEDYSENHSEQMLNAFVSFDKNERQNVAYRLNWFARLRDVSALRQELEAKLALAQWNFSTKTSFLATRDSVQTTRYWVSDNKLSYAFQKMEIGVTDLLEHNMFKDSYLDTLRANSNCFNEMVLYWKNRDSAWCNYGLSYKNRIEFQPSADTLQLSQRIHEVNGRLQVEKIKNQHFAMQATYRNQTLLSGKRSGNSEHYFVGNAEYNGRWLKNALVLTSYYEAGTGMELEKTYTFLKVAAGQGTHIWRDYNGDGVEDLGEFEVAAFQDEADYVKVWLSGTEYRNTFNSQFTQSVQLRPAAVWARKTGIRHFLSRFSDVAMYRTQVKQQMLNFNPFYAHLEDTQLVAKTMSFSNTFSFNNSTSPFAFDLFLQASQNKNLLYYGYEFAKSNAQTIVLKSTPCRWLLVEVTGSRTDNVNRSQSMGGRNYDLLTYAISEETRFQLHNKYIVEMSYSFKDKRNLEGTQNLKEHSVELLLSLKMAKRGVLTGDARYVGLFGSVGSDGTVSYQMLQGLAIGNNAIWGLSYQMSITDYLQLSLQYDGRLSQGHSAVHTGTLTVKAQF